MEGFAECVVSDGSGAKVLYSHRTSEHSFEMYLNCQAIQSDVERIHDTKLFSRVHKIRQFQVTCNALIVKLLL
jgi:hypothetical protein